ncbi:uncharacterized protein F5891DRAFT_1276666 [Suillus fuscotomentosus]|uniref:Uncharacterized protein n=1 Tax=Suillus fuscotomentosus TaxID=1912939 RepID=A0AAD4EDQ2_9AGAM|nr:uncharacterized protein F5891DRAFT_1276666 [Suillus fuscotomentosus]KAG1903094.1 hypothetical protein F5891DRAFT_1276666 [Suillus fuscotomentosus]
MGPMIRMLLQSHVTYSKNDDESPVSNATRFAAASPQGTPLFDKKILQTPPDNHSLGNYYVSCFECELRENSTGFTRINMRSVSKAGPHRSFDYSEDLCHCIDQFFQISLLLHNVCHSHRDPDWDLQQHQAHDLCPHHQ